MAIILWQSQDGFSAFCFPVLNMLKGLIIYHYSEYAAMFIVVFILGTPAQIFLHHFYFRRSKSPEKKKSQAESEGKKSTEKKKDKKEEKERGRDRQRRGGSSSSGSGSSS